MRLPGFTTIFFAAMLAASSTANAQAGRWPPADMLDRVYENAGPDELTAAGIMAAIGAGHSRYPVEDFFLRALERDPAHLLAAHSLLVHCARQSNVPICGNELFMRQAVDNDETNGSLWAAHAAARYRYAGPEAALPLVRRAAEAQTYDDLFQSYLALFNDFLRGARILPTHHLAFMMAFSGRSVIEVRMYGICQSEAGAEWTAACLQLGRTIEGTTVSSVADIGLRLQISMLERGGDPEQLRAARARQEALARTLQAPDPAEFLTDNDPFWYHLADAYATESELAAKQLLRERVSGATPIDPRVTSAPAETLTDQVGAGIAASAEIRAAVGRFMVAEKRAPADRSDLGLPPAPADDAAVYIAGIDVVAGQIVVTYGDDADEKLRGLTLVLTPYVTEAMSIEWHCGFAPLPADLAPAGGDDIVSTIPPDYMPCRCRP